MQNKFAFLLLNPFISPSEKEQKSDFSIINFLTNKNSHIQTLKYDKKNGAKQLMKNIGTGEELPNIINEAQKVLSQSPQSINLLTEHLKDKKSALHIIVNLAKVETLLTAFLKNWKGENQVFIHLALDKKSDKELLKQGKNFEEIEQEYPIILASLSGAKSIFNEEKDRKELQKVYDEIAFNQTQTSFTLNEYLEKQVEHEKEIQEIAPVSFVAAEPLNKNDALIILEDDDEAIENIAQIMEVSKKEEKKSDFSNFNPIFITKQLPNLFLMTITSPYLKYEGCSLLENKILPTLPERISEHESRQLYLGDMQHLQVISKYLNNGNGILLDGQKNIICTPLISEEGELLQTENESILKILEKEAKVFECFFLACNLRKNEETFLENFFKICEEEGIEYFLLDYQNQIIGTSQEYTISSTKDIQNYSKKILKD